MIRMAIKYLKYFLFAPHRKGYGIHSPFVFSFINEVLLAKDNVNVKDLIRQLSALKSDKRLLVTANAGAGSVKHASSERSLGSIVRNSSIKPKYGKLLYRMICVYKPDNILELGTGIGIASAWMAAADKNIHITTVDADKVKLDVAKEIHEKMGLMNISYVNKYFDEFLKDYSASGKVFMAFIDGNHSYEATIRYYKILVKQLDEKAVLIFDDIHWSTGMEKAWSEICEDQAAIISIDLFFMGIIFIRKGIPKQNFIVKF